jgi:hypothetical protein
MNNKKIFMFGYFRTIFVNKCQQKFGRSFEKNGKKIYGKEFLS